MTKRQTSLLALAALLLLPALPARAQSDRGWLARATAREYREQARFPESSHPLQAGDRDPVKEKRTPTKQSHRGPDGSGPALTVWADKVGFEHPKPIDLFAQIEGGVALQITGEVIDAAGNVIAFATYADDGRGADRKEGDGIWSARVTMPAGQEPDVAASYMVRVRARLLDGDVREAAGGFLYGNPAAHLTGRYRDELRDGNLIVSAEVDVTRPGRFHLAATLTSAKGEPVATAQTAVALEPGRSWIDLSFYGLIFHDRQVAGPYRVASVALATTTSMPNALNDLVENAHVTRAWRIDQMTAAPFADAKLLDAAGRLEADAARAQRQP
jgi:hypothetical protein